MNVRYSIYCVVPMLLGFGLLFPEADLLLAEALDREYVTTTPVLADGVLYVASSNAFGHRGHLRAIDVFGPLPVVLWDVAERMPLAGVGTNPGDLTSSDPPSTIHRDNRYRSLFTSLGGELLPLSPAQAGRLQPAMDVSWQAEAERLLHAVRGRRGGSPEVPTGSAEDPLRLWSISRSSPRLVGRSPYNSVASQRDRVLYAGAEDGMLHAFFVSRWNAAEGIYPVDDPDGGTELWAYLPGSFLPLLQSQPLANELGELAVHLDGFPVALELFLDLDGDGRRSWNTLLVATGTLLTQRRSCLFVLDVTDPYQPGLLWEKLLPGEGVGRTRGVAVSKCGTQETADTCLYLTADNSTEGGSAGINVLAVNLETGLLNWQFNAPYAATGPIAEATPAVPSLMDLDGDGDNDALVFGDLVGRLWVLRLADGQAHGGEPVYVTPGGTAEPIGAGVTVSGREVFFGTGGVDGTDNNMQYAVYAVEILDDGGHLRWTYPLTVGEKVWAAPVLDTAGNLLFATASDYLSLLRDGEPSTSGRVIALNHAGGEELSRGTTAANIGKVVVAPGVFLSVALTGQVTKFGAVSRLSLFPAKPGSVRILTWREL